MDGKVPRLNVLISAYACRPGEGSEPSVGWNTVWEVAKYHNVWVLTRANNRSAIEAKLKKHPKLRLEIIYCKPPAWLEKWNQNQRLVYLHYYWWQIKAYTIARQLHHTINFDLVHHVTYVRHSSPSFLALLPIPFLWGPVGGGETAPKSFWKDFGFRGIIYEIARHIACRLGELDPFVHLTAQRSVLARGTTEETTKRLRYLGAKRIEILSQLGLSPEEIIRLQQLAQSKPQAFRFISIGRLLHWKGFHLGLMAFAEAKLPEKSEYWIVGEGPERTRLETLARDLGISHKVKFWNKLSRQETLTKLSQCLALVHPSLHESGGLVCLEAMAVGRPVMCLNLGGPALQVTEKTGFKITADNPNRVVKEMATSMTQLVENDELWISMSRCSQLQVAEQYSWDLKGQLLSKVYFNLTRKKPEPLKHGKPKKS